MPRDLADPPDLAPEILWRSLLAFRPSAPISPRLRGAEHIPLSVCAVTSMAEARARDAGHLAAIDEDRRADLAAREVLALVLHTPTGRAFPSSAALARLEEHEVADLAGHAFRALADICPTYYRSNAKRWGEVLVAGARHPSNLAEASSLAACLDPTMGGPIPRPDRYWGRPFAELLDGHWFAWNAAREAMKR